MKRACEFFPSRGIKAKRAMTDNGFRYRATASAGALGAIKHV